MTLSSSSYDVLLVGGGVMGCATAYYLLKADPRLNVALIEMDATFARASTPLSDGNTRLQFNIPENIAMSQYGLEVLQTFADDMAVDGDRPDPAFRQQGNLFIIDEDSREGALEGLAQQQRLGCAVEWLTPEQVQEKYPIYNLKDCVGGTFGRLDGTMSPLAVLLGYKKKAQAMGAHWIDGKVTQLLTEAGRVTGVQLASGETLTAPVVVNTAGAWAAELARTAGIDLPVLPIKRQVTVFETPVHFEHVLPLLFLPSGLYVIHEGGKHFMAARSFDDDPITTEDFEWHRHHFEDLIWEELVSYIPVFDRLKITGGWAGLYEVNPFDGNAILGEWPELKGFYLENGYSGHGFQQCHAVGRYITELILGQTPTLDLSIFSPQRILDNQPVFENKRKII
ncbi:MAG: FAD-binding oxidoreductase [Anaerolineales bacterium]|nr:FAD-binding oxidoreductase [Anaerolineales bacterium]